MSSVASSTRIPAAGAPAAATLLAACVLVLIGGLQILRSRDVATEDARKDVRNLSASSAQQAERSIEGVEPVLGNVVDRLEGDVERRRLPEMLERQFAMSAELRDLAVADASGRVVAQAGRKGSPETVGPEILDRHKLHDDGAMHVDGVGAPAIGEAQVLSLTRRYNDARGSFGGVVVGHLDLGRVRSFYETLNVGNHGAIGLWSLDGRSILRQPEASSGDRSLQGRALFELAQRSAAGVYVGTSPVDGVERFVSFNRLDRYPLLLATAASSVDEVMAPWRHEALTQAIIIGIAALSLVGFGIALELRGRQVRASAAALARSEAGYRMLAEAATDMIVLTDMENVRRYVSPASLDLLGYPPEELVGRSPAPMIHPEDATGFHAMVAALKAGEANVTASTHRMRRKDGSYVWVEAKVRLVRADDGTPRNIMVAARDVTERQGQAEALKRAKEEAEAATRAKSDFLSGMSHELRTPLNSVVGFSRLLRDEDGLPAATIRRYARLVHEASTGLLGIVNDVLDLSKIEAGSVELECAAFSLRDLVELSASMLSGQAKTKGLAISVAVDPVLPDRLVGDGSRLRQILLNLLSNAVKFTAAGSVRIQVEGLDVSGTAATVRFAVTDTGIGIPLAKRHRLFQRFSQVDPSTERRFGGTGLGLSICRNLVLLMGGDVRVVSAEGTGSTFSFDLTLPIAAPSTAALAHKLRPPVRSARILVAEDTPMNQELMLAVLKGMGHKADVVADGAAAIAALADTTFDIVLMDMQMPVMDGVEAIRRIRALGAVFAALPIAALTANVDTVAVERCRAAGATAHLGKPFQPEELQDLIQELLEKRALVAECLG